MRSDLSTSDLGSEEMMVLRSVNEQCQSQPTQCVIRQTERLPSGTSLVGNETQMARVVFLVVFETLKNSGHAALKMLG